MDEKFLKFMPVIVKPEKEWLFANKKLYSLMRSQSLQHGWLHHINVDILVLRSEENFWEPKVSFNFVYKRMISTENEFNRDSADQPLEKLFIELLTVTIVLKFVSVRCHWLYK
jgi:hypothetical protein